MNPHPAFPPVSRIAQTPQLAVTGLLREALYAARLALRAAHPELAARSTHGLRPSAEVAQLLLSQTTLLAQLLAHYRRVLEAERSHPWQIPPAPPPWRPTDKDPF